MPYENFVREIVETYGLSPRLSERITTIANRRIAELGINNQGEIYRYVDYVVGKFNPRGEDRLTYSLDTAKRDDARTLQQRIGVEDPNLAIYTQRSYQQQEPNPTLDSISAAEIVDILRGNLGEIDFNILLQLAERGRMFFPELLLSREAIISKIPQIQERLEALAQDYARGGRLVIPPRPIVYVHFHPKLYIRFAYRQYNGNPIAFFEANRAAYEDIKTRTALVEFDSGLYYALYRTGQLHLAIPSKKLRTTEEHLSSGDVSKIFDGWLESGGSLTKAEKLTGVNRHTIRRVIWNRHRLKKHTV